MTQKLALASCDLRKLDLCLSEREREIQRQKKAAKVKRMSVAYEEP